jgi:hypothetical protein
MTKVYTLPGNGNIRSLDYNRIEVIAQTDTVTVNGKTLTAHEVVLALKELVTPAQVFMPGDHVRMKGGFSGYTFVVPDEELQEMLRQKYSFLYGNPDKVMHLVNLTNGMAYGIELSQLEKV